MIPYFELREIPIAAGRSISVFGTLVALGIFAGAWFSQRRARVTGITQQEIHGAIASVLVPGFLLAHVLTLTPLGGGHMEWSSRTVLQFWNGMSSFGGFAGAFLGLFFYHCRARRSWLPLADILMQALVIGWVFGRLGCTLVHDHIGAPSEFLLAIRFVDAGRHDLGLYEFLYTLIVLVPAVIILNRRPRLPGTSVAVLALLYAPARFLGDFLRHVDLAGADPRYLGLTPAQYGCVLLAGVGVAVAIHAGGRGSRRADTGLDSRFRSAHQEVRPPIRTHALKGALATVLRTCCPGGRTTSRDPLHGSDSKRNHFWPVSTGRRQCSTLERG